MASAKLPAHHVKTLLGGTRFRSPWSTWQAREAGGPRNTTPQRVQPTHVPPPLFVPAIHPAACPPNARRTW